VKGRPFELAYSFHFGILTDVFTLKAVNIGKKFGERIVFSAINLNLNTGDSVAVTGPNGSGKTTLLKVLVKLLRPSSGEVQFQDDDRVLDDDSVRARISFVAPYLNLYDQLTGEENLKFFAAVRGGNITGKEVESLLAEVGLARRGLDLVSTYSTGMKQRLKYAVALSGHPQLLFLDEPMSGLDDSGQAVVASIINKLRAECIIILATNEKEEYAFGQKQCRLGQ